MFATQGAETARCMSVKQVRPLLLEGKRVKRRVAGQEPVRVELGGSTVRRLHKPFAFASHSPLMDRFLPQPVSLAPLAANPHTPVKEALEPVDCWRE